MLRDQTIRIEANGLNHNIAISGDNGAPPALLLHGFPDSHRIWDRVTPLLVDAGFRLIKPDLRGFGHTDMATHKADYDINDGSIPDMIAILDALEISSAHLVGHDFGSPVAWSLAAQYPNRFHTLTSISVGHMRAFLHAGPEQYAMSWYILLHQCRGFCEWIYRSGDWRFARNHWTGHPDINHAVADLSRPGRLTAGLDWYRANLSLGRMVRPPRPGAFGEETIRIPTLCLWGDQEKYLSEKQMIGSQTYVDAPFRYERIEGAGHWAQFDAPETVARHLLAHWNHG